MDIRVFLKLPTLPKVCSLPVMGLVYVSGVLSKKKSEVLDDNSVPAIFCLTKEFPKNTKENMPYDRFCSHFIQEGQMNLILSPDCCIFIAVSNDTHIADI